MLIDVSGPVTLWPKARSRRVTQKVGWLTMAGAAISQGALIAGGVFAAVQFLETQKDAHVARTMEYILRYEDGRVGESRRAINAALRPHIDQFAEIGAISAEDRRAMVFTILDESGDGTLRDHIDTIVDFYEGLWTCVREDICAADVAFGYFGGTEAAQFRSNFEPYLQQRRQNNPEYGKGLDRFASHPISQT